MKQRQQLGNRARVTSQINHGAGWLGLGDTRDQLPRQCLVVFQTNNCNRAAIRHEAFAERGVGGQWPSTNWQNPATRVDQHQRLASNGRKVASQTLADVVYQRRIQLHLRRWLAGHHDGQFRYGASR